MYLTKTTMLDMQEACILRAIAWRFSGFQVFWDGDYEWYGNKPGIQEKKNRGNLSSSSSEYKKSVFRFKYKPQKKRWEAVFGGSEVEKAIQEGLLEYRKYLGVREENFRRYIDKIDAIKDELSSTVAEMAWTLWLRVKEVVEANERTLDIPDCCLGNNDDFMMTWSINEFYLECQISVSGKIEWFSRNRSTKEIYGLDFDFDESIFASDEECKDNKISKKTIEINQGVREKLKKMLDPFTVEQVQSAQ